jgi:hypothetical protein
LCLHDSDRRASAANTSHVAREEVGDEVGDGIVIEMEEMEVMVNSWIKSLRVNITVGGQREGHRHQ